MTNRPLALLAVLCLGALSPTGLIGDEIHLGQVFQHKPNQYLAMFDPARDEYLVFQRSANAVDPLVRVYDPAGTHRLSINPLKDLAGGHMVDVDLWDVAPTPDGGLLLSVIVSFATNKDRTTRKLVRYDSNGALKWARDVGTYHAHFVSEDANGYVYTVGHTLQNRGSKSGQDYGVLIRYSPDGNAAQELLRESDLAPEGASPFGDARSLSLSRMRHRGNTLMLYFGTQREVFRFDVSKAKLETRISFERALEGAASAIGTQAGGAQCNMIGLGLRNDGRAVAHLSKCQQDSSGACAQTLVCISADGTSWERCGPVLSDTSGRFLGVDRQERFVFWSPTDSGPVFRRE